MPKIDVEGFAAALETPCPAEKALNLPKGMSKQGRTVATALTRIVDAYQDELAGARITFGEPEAQEVAEPAAAPEVPAEKAKDMEAETKAAKDYELALKAQADKIAALEKENKATSDALQELAAKRAKEIWQARAEKSLAHVPGSTTEDLAELLYGTEKSQSAEAAEALFATLEASSKAVAQSEALKTVGTRGSAVSEGKARLEEAAKALMAADPKLDAARARIRAVKQNPELYAELAKERG